MQEICKQNLKTMENESNRKKIQSLWKQNKREVWKQNRREEERIKLSDLDQNGNKITEKMRESKIAEKKPMRRA